MRIKRLTKSPSRWQTAAIHRDRQRDRPFEAGATSAAQAAPGANSCGDPPFTTVRPEDGCDVRPRRAGGQLHARWPRHFRKPAMSLATSPSEIDRLYVIPPCCVGHRVPPLASIRGAAAANSRSSLDLRHAGSRIVTLRYETYGDATLPAVFVAGGISAHRHVASQRSVFRRRLVGGAGRRGPRARSARACVVAFDWLGADGELDAVIDPADQADAIAAVLDALGIERLAGFRRLLLRRDGRPAVRRTARRPTGPAGRDQRRASRASVLQRMARAAAPGRRAGRLAMRRNATAWRWRGSWRS